MVTGVIYSLYSLMNDRYLLNNLGWEMAWKGRPSGQGKRLERRWPPVGLLPFTSGCFPFPSLFWADTNTALINRILWL